MAESITFNGRTWVPTERLDALIAEVRAAEAFRNSTNEETQGELDAALAIMKGEKT